MSDHIRRAGRDARGATGPASGPRPPADRGYRVLPVEGHLPSFEGATGWLNSEPLTPEGLRGRVVLVDFWTYTCINWLRTLPYVRAWAAKYRDHGLTMIGVHTPEFDFERDVDNIIAQSRAFRVTYPIAVDSDYGVWQAFDNHYWPAVYIADAQGRIRYHHFGEGEYAMKEMVIQQLLVEAGADGFDPDLVTVDPADFEVAADYRTLRIPETYLGYGQAPASRHPTPAVDSRTPTPEPRLGLNQWAPSGTWTLAPQPRSERARRPHRVPFQARDVNLVMGPATRGASVPFRFSSTGGRRRPRRATSTTRATARSPTSVCTNSSASRARSPSGASRSSSSTPAPRRIASPSAEVGGRTRKDADVYKCGR